MDKQNSYGGKIISYFFYLVPTEIKEMLTIVLRDLRFGSAVVHQVSAWVFIEYVEIELFGIHPSSTNVSGCSSHISRSLHHTGHFQDH